MTDGGAWSVMNIAGFVYDIDFAIDETSVWRKEALWEVAKRIGARRPCASEGALAKALLSRERLGSTAIGGGIAVPHMILDDPWPPLILVTRLKNAIEYDAPDEAAVDILLGVVGNRNDLKWLQAAIPRFSTLVKDRALANELRTAGTVEEAGLVLARLGLQIMAGTSPDGALHATPSSPL